jgi:hypothetical protein
MTTGSKWLAWALLAGSGAAAAAELPTLSEAFGDGVPGLGGLLRGDALYRVDLPVDRYPEALCADGTPVPLYVRRASDARHRDDWIVYLQGGGSCGSGQQCFERWRGRDGNFGANKLSSRFAPRGGIAGGGIHGRDARNPFAGWNHVYVYYCSSDGWSGQTRDRATAASAGAAAAPTPYRLHFLGARIVDATFDLLHGGAGPVTYLEAGGTAAQLPDMDAARLVLFTGSSAGGGGVIRNADRVRDMLQSRHGGCDATGTACLPRVAAVIDGSLGLSRAALDHSQSTACGALAPCTYEVSLQLRWNAVVRGFWGALTDASCLARQPAAEAWRCSDGELLAQHYVSTPFFVRSDLQDSLVMGNALEAGFRVDGAPLDRIVYGQRLELELLALAAGQDRSEPVPVPIGVFAPQCGEHVGLDQNPASFRHGVQDGAGEPRYFLQTLASWLRGEAPVVVQRFDPAGRPASCGAR